MPGSGGIKAGKAFVVVEALDKTGAILNRVADKVKSLGASIAGVGAKLIGLSSAGLAPFTAAVTSFASTGAAIDKIAKQTGNSANSVSKLVEAAREFNVETDDMVGAMEELNIRLGEAVREGTGPLAETFKKLGIDAKKFAALPVTQQFEKLADVLSNMDDRALRQFSADEIFGGDAFKILPLLEQGGAKLAKRLAEIKGMSEEDVAAAAKLSQAWNKVKASFMRVVNAVGGAVAPVFQQLLDKALPVIEKAATWIKENKRLVATIFKVVAAVGAAGGVLLALGTTIGVVGFAISGFATIMGAVSTVVTALVSPIGLLVAGVVAAGGAFLYFNDTARNGLLGALESVKGTLSEIKGTFLQAWQGIQDAMKGGDLKLAATIAWQGVKIAWLQGTTGLLNKWTTFWGNVKKAQLTAHTWLAEGMLNMWQGIKKAWTSATGGLKIIFLRFFEFIAKKMAAFQSTILTGAATALEKLPGQSGLVDELRGAAAAIEKVPAKFGKWADAAELATGDRLNQIKDEREELLKNLHEDDAAKRAKLDAATRKAIEDRIDKLDAEEQKLKELNRQAEELRKASEEAAKAAKEQRREMPGLDVGNLALAGPQVSPGSRSPIAAAEKGTRAAIEAFMKNQDNNIEKQQLDRMDKQIAELREIKKNTRDSGIGDAETA